MNAPTLYNPCDDGFPAKAWECLRRSTIFFKSCSELIAYLRKDDEKYMEASGVYHDSARDLFLNFRHPFHQMAAYYLFDSPCISFDRSTLLCDVTFPELDVKVQSDIRESFERKTASLFDIKGWRQPSTMRVLRELEADDLEILVRIPKVVWDNDHKRAVLKQIEGFLGKPLSTKKRLKPNGRTLGTKGEWDSFLLCERWNGLGYGRGRAAILAAYEIYDGVVFSGGTEQLKEKAKTCEKWHQRASKVQEQVSIIEKAINCVYPRFDIGST